MCGIAGVIGPSFPDEGRIQRALALMGRRGPDGAGAHCERLGDQAVCLLHSRLAIIDVSERADQPFKRDDAALVFNGEIYNYIEVRRELMALGHVFDTASDTEVLLKAWRQWGADCFDRLEGMWAFALIDRIRGQVIFSRDRFGEKPLFYWKRGDTLYFGSEVKFLAALAGDKPECDLEQLRRFLVYGYKSLYKKPRSWFKDVHELPAASWAQVDGRGDVRSQTYWSLRYAPAAMTAEDALEGTRERLFEAVRLRLRADVPIAFCLSGGVDSTVLAGVAARKFAQPMHTFSIIDDDERYCETDNIDQTIAYLGCENHRIRTGTTGFFDDLAEQVAYHDAPVTTASLFLHAALLREISRRGFKVAVSGVAADELFTGYYDHYAFWLAAMRDRADFPDLIEQWKAGYGAYVQNPLLQNPKAFIDAPYERGHIILNADLFQQWMVEPLEEPFGEENFTPDLLRNRMLNELFHEIVPVLLKEHDLNSMFYSVENRSPYLDRPLAEFLYTVPPEYLVRDGLPKFLLRAAGEGLCPDAVRLDNRKRGFNVAVDSLVDRSDPQTRERLLADGPIFDIVRRDALEAFLQGDMKENSFSKFLFSFISAKLFLDRQKDWVV